MIGLFSLKLFIYRGFTFRADLGYFRWFHEAIACWFVGPGLGQIEVLSSSFGLFMCLKIQDCWLCYTHFLGRTDRDKLVTTSTLLNCRQTLVYTAAPFPSSLFPTTASHLNLAFFHPFPFTLAAPPNANSGEWFALWSSWRW